MNVRLAQLEGINKMSAEEKCNQSSHQILQWLDHTEEFLGEEPKFNDLNAIKAHQRRLAEILHESKSHEENLEVISNASQKAQTPDVAGLETLKTRYAEVKAILDERNGNLNSCGLSCFNCWYN